MTAEFDSDLCWINVRENVTLAGRQLLREVMKEVLAEARREFDQRLMNGQLISVSVEDAGEVIEAEFQRVLRKKKVLRKEMEEKGKAA